MKRLKQLEGVINYFVINLITCWVCAIIGTVLLCTAWINYKKQFTRFTALVPLLLIGSIILVTLNGNLYRDARKINKYVEQNCLDEISILDEKDLK